MLYHLSQASAIVLVPSSGQLMMITKLATHCPTRAVQRQNSASKQACWLPSCAGEAQSGGRHHLQLSFHACCPGLGVRSGVPLALSLRGRCVQRACQLPNLLLAPADLHICTA